MSNCKHCTKCHSFAWWDGDFCCTMRMSIMEKAENGKFWALLPETFNAEKCEDYDERENYDTDVHDYYGQYIKFLRSILNDENNFFNENFLLEKYGYRDYKKNPL